MWFLFNKVRTGCEMKKLFLTTGLLSILTMPAMADLKWFVGANIGYAGPTFSDDINDSIDDDTFEDDSGGVALSVSGGMRFGLRENIYNGGVTATLSYMPTVGKVKSGSDWYASSTFEGTMDLTTLYFSYDNYIRLSGDSEPRSDFVISVGVGHSWLHETAKAKSYYYTYEDSVSDDGAMGVLKLGLVSETSINGLGWNVMLTFIGLNASAKADLQGAYSIDFGLRYTF